MELPTTEEIKGYVADFREFLQEETFPERKALIRNFVEGIEVTGDEATLTYTIPISQSTTRTEVLVGGGLGCNERGRSHLLTDLVRQTNELAPNGPDDWSESRQVVNSGESPYSRGRLSISG